MLEIISKDKCCGCFACYNVCPKNCISMRKDKEGFLYPFIDTKKCINCGLCEKSCPEILGVKANVSKKKTYAVINKDERIRLNSSSGGFFSLLATEILNNGGVVFGAAMSEDCKTVEHIKIESLDLLEKLRGSKYVQSYIGDTYRQAKQFLENGRKVLFVGTPCQISGLYKFLDKEYFELVTCDFICHGVPSPLVWEKYVKLIEGKNSSKLKRVFFRNKKYGWKRFSLKFEFADGSVHSQILHKDLYLRGFRADLYLRPSCYNCTFKGLERNSDITLGDLWGAGKITPDLDDDKGISLVVVNSQKGSEIFKRVKQYAEIREVDLELAVKYNSAAVSSVKEPTLKRNNFFKEIEKVSFNKLMKKYCSVTFKEKIRRTVGRIIRKFIKR